MRSARKGGRGRSQKASIIDILPRSTTVTDRRKFSPGSLLIRTLPSSRDPSPPPSLSLSKQEDRPAEFCRGKNEIRGRWFDDHGMQPPWTVILEEGRGRGSEEGGSKIETITPLPPVRKQHPLSFFKRSRNLKRCVREESFYPLPSRTSRGRDVFFRFFSFLSLSSSFFFYFFFFLPSFFGIFLDKVT